MTIMASMVSRMTRTHLTDATSGFRAADRRAMTIFARHYPAEYLGDTIDSLVLAHRAGLTIREKPVTMRPRQGGSPSQGTFRSVLYLLRAMLALTMAVIRPAPEVSE